jgi:hypothetical protein
MARIGLYTSVCCGPSFHFLYCGCASFLCIAAADFTGAKSILQGALMFIQVRLHDCNLCRLWGSQARNGSSHWQNQCLCSHRLTFSFGFDIFPAGRLVHVKEWPSVRRKFDMACSRHCWRNAQHACWLLNLALSGHCGWYACYCSFACEISFKGNRQRDCNPLTPKRRANEARSSAPPGTHTQSAAWNRGPSIRQNLASRLQGIRTD